MHFVAEHWDRVFHTDSTTNSDNER